MVRENLEMTSAVPLSIFEEEDISSFMTRAVDCRLADTRKGIFGELGTPNAGRMAWAFPSHLAAVTSLFPNYLPELSGVIERHTRYPLFAPFLEKGKRRELHSHLTGRKKTAVSTAYGIGNRTRMGICMKCVRDDLSDPGCGVAYWRRAHLIPGASYCVKHQELLRTFCEVCETGHRRSKTPMYPTEKCCHRPLRLLSKPRTSKAQEALLNIDRMALQLLRGEIPIEVEPGLISTHLSGRMRRDGLEGRFYGIRDTFEILEKTLGKSVIEHFRIGRLTVQRLLGGMQSLGAVIDPMKNIALVSGVFGTWEGLQREVQLRSNDREAYHIAGIRTPKRIRTAYRSRAAFLDKFSKLTKSEFRVHRAETRAFILERLSQNPGSSRNQINRMRGGRRHYNFALLMDARWFEKVLPKRRLDSQKPAPRSVAATKLLVQRIRRRRKLLLKTKPEKFISRAALLNDSTCESLPGHAEKQEEVAQALEECVDTWEDYNRRRVSIMCKAVRRKSKTCVYGDESTYSNLSRDNITRRLFRARKWLREH